VLRSQQQAQRRNLLSAQERIEMGQALAMELNGGAEQGWVGSGNDNGRLKGDTGIRTSDAMKADSGNRSGLYMETDTTLAGTLSTRVTAMI